MKTNKITIYILVVFSMLIWGISYILLEMLYDYITPITTAAIRVLIATVFMLILSISLKKFQKIEKKDLLIFMLFALIDPFLYFICESYGLLYSSPTIAAIIIATIPLLTPIAAALFTKERLNWVNILGITVSFLGVLLVIIERDFKLAILPIGLTLLMAAVLCAVTYNFFIKRLAKKYNVYTIITTQNIFSSIYFLPLFIIYGISDLVVLDFNYKVISNILILSIFASALAFIFYAKGIKEIGITKANVFANMIPVFTAIFAFFILGETLNPQKIFGICLVVFGLFFTQFTKKNKIAQ